MQFAHPRLSIGQNNQAWENSVFQLLNLTTDWPHDDAKSPAQNDSATKCISNLQSPLFIHFGDGEKTCTSSYPQVLLQNTLRQKSVMCQKKLIQKSKFHV